MELLIVSHKRCWPSQMSPTGFATDGGFAFQAAALSALFDRTTLLVPVAPAPETEGEIALRGDDLSVKPLTVPRGLGFRRKLNLALWLARNLGTLLGEIRRAGAVHAPIPGDVGTLGMLLAYLLRKPFLVRYCGNWDARRNVSERFWHWFMEATAGGRNVMLATGGRATPPSARNPNVKWIFATSLSEEELRGCYARNVEHRISSPRLILAGRQEPGKGADVVIESLPRIIEHFPGTTLGIVGDGSALGDLKEQAVLRGLSDRVVFHGRVSHERVLALFRQADLFCYPTSSEGFPKVVIEAMACGLPVVTTPVSVLPRLLAAGGGVLIQKPSAGEVCRAVQDCLANPARYSLMSERAVATAKEYSLESWGAAIGDLLRQSWGRLKSDPVVAVPDGPIGFIEKIEPPLRFASRRGID